MTSRNAGTGDPSLHAARGVPVSSSLSVGSSGSLPPSTALTGVHDFSLLTPAEAAIATRHMADANLRRNRNQFTQAIIAFERVLELCPTFVPGWTGKAACYRGLKEYGPAVQCLQTALQLDPTDWVAYDHLGLVYKESDLFEKAIEQYHLAIKYGPIDCPAKEHLAVVLCDWGTRLKLAGSTEKAVQTYNDALAAHPQYWPALFNLGVVCLAADTRIAIADGRNLCARDVTPKMRLLDQRGTPIAINTIRTGRSERMIRLRYGAGEHTVTPRHQVTLRWAGQPKITTSHTHMRIEWTDQRTIETRCKVWRFNESIDPTTSSVGPSTFLPLASLPFPSAPHLFARHWLSGQSRLGFTSPFHRGDLFEMSAVDLLTRFECDPYFRRRIDIPRAPIDIDHPTRHTTNQHKHEETQWHTQQNKEDDTSNDDDIDSHARPVEEDQSNTDLQLSQFLSSLDSSVVYASSPSPSPRLVSPAPSLHSAPSSSLAHVFAALSRGGALHRAPQSLGDLTTIDTNGTVDNHNR